MGSGADIRKVAADERPGASRALPAKPAKLDSLAPILVIEDDYFAAAELTRLLEAWDAPTLCAGRIDVARRLAREMRPKLALVDINLEQGFEGIELARELQALYGTKIVFVTAYHVRDLMHRLTGAENMAVLFKPVEPDVLATVLSQISVTIDSAH
jgi:DNA-binding response OmpR family regulator